MGLSVDEYTVVNSFGGMVIGAGGAKATGIALSDGSVGFRLRGVGMEIRRGR
jgi:hypothetical protein